MITVCEAVVKSFPALFPMTTLNPPEVISFNVPEPKATLLLPVVKSSSTLYPTAILLLGVVAVVLNTPTPKPIFPLNPTGKGS